MHIHFTHAGLLATFLGLHNSHSASMLLGDSTDIKTQLSEMQAGERIFQILFNLA